MRCLRPFSPRGVEAPDPLQRTSVSLSARRSLPRAASLASAVHPAAKVRQRWPHFALSPHAPTVLAAERGDTTDRSLHKIAVHDRRRGGAGAAHFQHDRISAHIVGPAGRGTRWQVLSPARRGRRPLPGRALHRSRLSHLSLAFARDRTIQSNEEPEHSDSAILRAPFQGVPAGRTANIPVPCGQREALPGGLVRVQVLNVGYDWHRRVLRTKLVGASSLRLGSARPSNPQA